MTDIKIVNEDGKLVGKDIKTGETVPIQLGETVLDSLNTGDAYISLSVTWPDGSMTTTSPSEVSGGVLANNGSDWQTFPVQQRPAAVYDAEHNTTYISYSGDDADPFIFAVNHDRDVVGSIVNLGTNPLPNDDQHGQPTLCITSDGYIHSFWGAHNTHPIHSVTDSPYDISSWTTQIISTVPKGTYLSPVAIGPNIYVLYRTSPDSGVANVDDYPSHKYATIIESTDNGSSWSDIGPVVDGSDHPDTHFDANTSQLSVHEGNLHFSWKIAHGNQHGDVTGGVYHAYLDLTDGTIYDLAGNAYGGTVTWADHSSGVLRSHDSAFSSSHIIEDDGTVHIACADNNTDNVVYSVFSDGSWETEDAITLASGPSIRLTDAGKLQIVAVQTDPFNAVLSLKESEAWETTTFDDVQDIGRVVAVPNVPDDKIPILYNTGTWSDDYTGNEVVYGLGNVPLHHTLKFTQNK